MLVLLHVVIGCGILFRIKVYQNLYSELKSSPLFYYELVSKNSWLFLKRCCRKAALYQHV